MEVDFSVAWKVVGMSTPNCFLVKNTELGYTRQKFNNTGLKTLDFCWTYLYTSLRFTVA